MTSSSSQHVRGMVPLDRTPEDVAAGIFRIRAHNGAIAQLTARQVEIMSMPREQKIHVPHSELVELGKILMPMHEVGMDNMLRDMDENPPQIPQFVPEPYEYAPLVKPTSLRLMQILAEDEDGMLHVSLDDFDLDEHVPHYICLSYCWSNPHAKSNTFSYYDDFAEDYSDDNVLPISCNGRLMFIRPNLYDALKQLPEAPGLQIKRWVKFNGSFELLTDLQSAAAEGNLGLTKTVIFRGAFVDARDSQGRTALMLAIINGHLPVVRTLLEAGSNPEIRDYHNLNCVDHALRHDHYEITDYLLTFSPGKSEFYQRKNKHIGQGVRMWVDAICINQDNLQEKSEQVNVMDRIYTQASSVTVWLGRDDGTAASAAAIIRKLYSVIAVTDTLVGTGIQPYQATDASTALQNNIPVISQQEWHSLAALYLRQQFHRLWCLQEAVLPEHVVMYLGAHEIPWHEFMLVTEQLHMLQKNYMVAPSCSFRPVYTAPIESEAHLISELRMRKTLDGTSSQQREAWFHSNSRFWRGENQPCQIPLLEMIASTMIFECYDPRDHVYALIGMCKNHPDSPAIEVDYERPYEEIYTEIMRLCIKDSELPNLRIVAAIRDSALNKNESLPGWVLHFGRAGVSSFWDVEYAAAGQESRTFDFPRSSRGRSNELILEGQRLDTIKQVATKRNTEGQVTMLDFDPTWPSLVLSLPQIYPHTNQARTEVLWRTLCTDKPSKDDIRLSQRDHSKEEQSTSAEPLSSSSKAPKTYANQFRDQFCASMLSHAEKAADLNLKLRLSKGGILLQAMMALQLNSGENSERAGVHRITAPSETEVLEMYDTSLEGPYYSSPAISRAIQELDVIYQSDSIEFNGPGCATPSRSELSAFLKKPLFRVWRPSPNSAAPEVTITNAALPHGPDTQVLDTLPPGQDGFRTCFVTANGGRRLFVTEHHKYLGLGGMSMELGDEIWVVKGSRVPFLLRKVGEEYLDDIDGVATDIDPSTSDEKGKGVSRQRRTLYKYIGDLYVHGVMDGEGVDPAGDWEEIALV